MDKNGSTIPKILTVAIGTLILVIVVISMIPSIQQAMEESRLARSAEAKVQSWADKLAKETTPSGTYRQYPTEDLPETDSWGNMLKVSYSNGLVMEELTVRSAGKDKLYNTSDDLTATRKKASLKGVGRSIKDNIEETAENGAKGAARGTVKGFIEGIKEGLKGKDKEENKKDEDKK